MDDRRRKGRIRRPTDRRRILVRFQLCGAWAQGEIVRLGREGVFVQTELCMDPGDELLLLFSVDAYKLELSGTVVRSGQGSEPQGFFVLLDSPGEKYRELYEEFTRE